MNFWRSFKNFNSALNCIAKAEDMLVSIHYDGIPDCIVARGGKSPDGYPKQQKVFWLHDNKIMRYVVGVN